MKLPIPQVLVFLTVLALVITGTAGLLAWRLVGVLDLSPPWAGLGVAAVFAWVALIVAGMILPRLLGRGPWYNGTAQLAYVNMGLLSVLLCGVLIRDLLVLSWLALAAIPAFAAATGPAPSDQVWFYSNVIVVLVSMGLVTVGWRQARATPSVRRVVVELPGQPASLDGLTIVQLSDIHIGPTIDGDWLKPVIARSNALKPDLVVITGDLVDGSVADLAAQVAPLSDLVSRHGTWFVTGNHEYYSGALDWLAHLDGLGIHTLTNTADLLEHDGGRLLLAGVPDHDAARIVPSHRPDPAAALAGAPPRDLTVLLAHQPRTAQLAQGLGVDLQLSGHTHGGQFWPWMHLVWLQQPVTAGLAWLGDVRVYTSRGTGYWGPPLRLGAPAEITELVLRAAPTG